MTPQLNDFAPELLHCVFRFCSQSDLVSLSWVNHTFQHAAEHVLYRYIHISCGLFLDTTPSSIAKKSLFSTLTSNPQKAGLLRCLNVQLEFDGNYIAKRANDLFLERIVDALRNAHGLVDLRIMVHQLPHAFERKLSELIKRGYFQLHTLYCDSYQDLEGIIASQKHLRLLGIHNDHYYGYLNVSGLITNRRNSRIDNWNIPGIFMLTCRKPSYNVSLLTMFPELCPPGQALALCTDIATSLGRDLGMRYDTAPVDHNCMLEIHVFDFSNAKTAIICEVAEAMVQFFVDRKGFRMWVQTSKGKETVSKPWRIPGVSVSISRLKQLRSLEFYVSRHDQLWEAGNDLRSFLFEENLVHTGLAVAKVWHDDESLVAFLHSDYGWNVVIVDNNEN